MKSGRLVVALLGGFLADAAPCLDRLGIDHFPDHLQVHQFAQLVKIYDSDFNRKDIVIRADKMPLYGDPDPAHISTSFIESSNLHMRMQNRRYGRLTNAHSKKIANHCHMLAIGFMFYNYARTHMTLKETPAQAAGLADHRWTMKELVEMMDAHFERKTEAEFEAAFAAKYTSQRKLPRAYPPTPKDELPLPWYLDPKTEQPPEGLDL